MLESVDNLDERKPLFCFICDNPIIETTKCHADDGKSSNVQVSSFFCSIMTRYLDLKPFEATAMRTISASTLMNDDNNITETLECCKSCSDIAKTVCKLYDELKNVQLRLNWNLGKIGEIMKNCNENANNQLSRDKWGEADFKRQFMEKVDIHKQEEYPHLKLDKITPPKEQRQNLENQTVFIVKIETCNDDDHDDNEKDSVWDPDNHDEDNCELSIKMDTEIVNHDDVECPVEPEDVIKVKAEPTEDKNKIIGETEIKIKRRKKIPNSERKIPCAFCEKRFNYKNNLYRHERVSHKGEKLYPCPTCGERFSNAQERRAHQVSHKPKKVAVSKVSKVECRFCGKQFPRNKERVRHEWTHTKLRPFLCSVCGRKFNDAGNSVKHLRKEHGNVDDAKIVKCFNSYRDFKDIQTHLETQK